MGREFHVIVTPRNLMEHNNWYLMAGSQLLRLLVV